MNWIVAISLSGIVLALAVIFLTRWLINRDLVKTSEKELDYICQEVNLFFLQNRVCPSALVMEDLPGSRQVVHKHNGQKHHLMQGVSFVSLEYTFAHANDLTGWQIKVVCPDRRKTVLIGNIHGVRKAEKAV
jgi:hypothetical protein